MKTILTILIAIKKHFRNKVSLSRFHSKMLVSWAKVTISTVVSFIGINEKNGVNIRNAALTQLLEQTLSHSPYDSFGPAYCHYAILQGIGKILVVHCPTKPMFMRIILVNYIHRSYENYEKRSYENYEKTLKNTYLKESSENKNSAILIPLDFEILPFCCKVVRIQEKIIENKILPSIKFSSSSNSQLRS